MASWRLCSLITLFVLSTSLSKANASQFLLQPPAGYGSSHASSDRSVPKSDFDTPYTPFGQIEDLYTWEPLGEAEVPELSALSEAHFTRVGHSEFPNHSVRIKKSATWCDPSVDSYTGYIDIGPKHLFFYFFESRSPSDDIILWTNGGPGCSSSLGLFMELGPCQVRTEADISEPKFNPHSWNNNSSVIFIDQPVGVGFSYADYGEHVGRTEDAAKDVAAFVSIFFENFINKKPGADNVKFHLAGESYGGRYIPVFAAEVLDQNMRLKDKKTKPIPLKSVMIGNGITDFATMATSYYDMTCTNASIKPVLPVSTCVRMRKAVPRCDTLLRTECLDRFDSIACFAALSTCSMELEQPFWGTGLNPYDISQPCDGPIEETLCYPQTKYITIFLNLLKTRKALGVSNRAPEYSGCNDAVGEDFYSHMDRARMTTPYIEALLERDVRVLIYVGTNDWICNHVGNYRWTETLKWSGHKEFSAQSMREWKVEGKVAGETRNANGLTFATVFDAGHMVPLDRPKQALAMVNRWLANQEL